MRTASSDAPMFDEVQPPRSFLGIAVFCVAAIAGMVAGALIGQKIIAPQVAKRLPPPADEPIALAIHQGTYLVAGFAPVVALVAAGVRMRENRSLESLGLRDESAGKNLLTGAAVGTSLVLLPTLATMLLERSVRISFVKSDAPTTQFAATSAVLAALTFQSFAEELIFRGWLLPTLAPCVGNRAALLFSSATFAASHLLNGGVTLVALLNLTLAGCILGTLTLQTRTIWAATAAHSLWNFMEIAGIPFGETVPKTGALLLAVPTSENTDSRKSPTDGLLFAGIAAILLFGLHMSRPVSYELSGRQITRLLPQSI